MPNSANNSLPPLEWVRSFEAAGRLGNFTTAANDLGLTQASISQHIRALEDWLDITLFRRLPRGVELTADGEAYLPHIENALSLIRRGTSDLFGRPGKQISIAAPASVLALWIAPRLAGLASDVHSFELNFSSVHRDVDYDQTETDYQIRYGHGDWPGKSALRLYRESLVPACAPSLKRTLRGKGWGSLPVLSVKGARDGWQEWAKAKDKTLPSSPILRFDSFISALYAAKSGAGILLASLPLIQEELKNGTLLKLEETAHQMASGAWITWQKDRILDATHDRLLEILTSSRHFTRPWQAT